MYYDTHCHPYLSKEKSQKHILENFFSGGGSYINTVAVDVPSSLTSIELSKQYPGVFASIGIHPTSTQDYKAEVDKAMQELELMHQEEKKNIVAIGETGLDYHWLESLSKKYKISEEEIIETQKCFFRSQIKLAAKLKLPLIIHNRNAKDDIFEILLEEKFKNFVFHCYSEDLDYAQRLIAFAPECKLGFGGVITFKSALSVQETVKHIPLANIIIETDSPYLTPSPFRGKQENEPLYCKYVLDKIVDLRNENFEEIKNTILYNSVRFFGIK